jgi:pimeloyl-ACP methyl ester carboxylesterase
MPRMPKLQQLAHGLATEIETLHPDRRQITLVAHSLGGIVARRYLLDEIKAGRKLRITKLLLYAVPNTGASLAAVGTWLSWRHEHLTQLRQDSDILDILNNDWVTERVEEKVDVHYVVGGADKIVGSESARPYYGQNNVSTIIGHNHRSIVAATGYKDIRYATLRRFVLPQSSHSETTIAPVRTAQGPTADPIFDIYAAKDEPYYIKRDVDKRLLAAMTAGHVWLSGPSGVGKTAALRRSALAAGWKLKNLVLGAYQGEEPINLLHAIVVELGEAVGQTDLPTKGAGAADLLTSFRRCARSLPDDIPSTVLIEELPLAPGAPTRDFLTLIQNLILAIEADESIAGRIQLSFSSINDPTLDLGRGAGKLRETLQFLGLVPWNEPDLISLIVMLTPIIKPNLLPSDQEAILREARGSPRFVKMIFRRWRSGAGADLSLSQLLTQVSAEQV